MSDAAATSFPFTQQQQQHQQQMEQQYGVSEANASVLLLHLAQDVQEYQQQLVADLRASEEDLDTMEQLNALVDQVFDDLASMQLTIRRRVRKLKKKRSGSSSSKSKKNQQQQQKQDDAAAGDNEADVETQ